MNQYLNIWIFDSMYCMYVDGEGYWYRSMDAVW